MSHSYTITPIRDYSLRVFFFIFCSILIPSASFAELVDKVVAVVNDDIITLSEVEQEAEGLYRVIAQKNSGESLLQILAEARQKTIDSLIDRKLIAQRAKQFNVSVNEKEIEDGFEKVRARSGLSKTEFTEKLKESGMTEKSYRSNIGAQILQGKLVSFDVRSKVIITEAAILDYYDENYTHRVEAGTYYLLQIGFTWEKDTDSEKLTKNKEKTRNRAERVYNLALNGQDFKMLAKKFSNLPSAADGGDIGTFTLDEMASGMRSAVGALAPGGISEIVETNAGYQFFKLLSGDESKIVITSSFEDAREEIKQKLYDQELQEAYSEWIQKLKEKAYIQKL
jgi:peptidyl-prolyl cis-trans isomerase SurA